MSKRTYKKDLTKKQIAQSEKEIKKRVIDKSKNRTKIKVDKFKHIPDEEIEEAIHDLTSLNVMDVKRNMEHIKNNPLKEL